MTKMMIAVLLAGISIATPAWAACSPDDAMNKAAAVSDVLGGKIQSKPDDASKMMTEMGTIVGSGDVNDQTCTKLDDLMTRAKKL